MSAIAIDFESNPFQPVSIEYHEMMAKALTIRRSVISGANYLGIAKDFWSLSRLYASLLADLNKLTAFPNDDLAKILVRMRELHEGLVDLLIVSKKKGLLNRSLTATSIRSVMAKNEELQDLIVCFELSIEPETKEKLDAAFRDFQSGETVSLESLVF